MEYVNILLNEPPLIVQTRLTKLIGLNEAIVLEHTLLGAKKVQRRGAAGNGFITVVRVDLSSFRFVVWIQ